ncbi:MAG: hypothetical protein R3349_03040, partial [Geminicoccaceae bacterium]|nr:hypothetical protein [Geminicoccaceae bacterium]
LACLLSALLLAPAGAAGGPLALADVLCAPEPSGTADARRLVRQLLELRPVPDSVLDANRDGDTMFYEKREAILDPGYCARPEIVCSPEVAAALSDHRAALAALLDDPRIRLERAFAAAEGETASDPALGPSSVLERLTPADLLDEQQTVRLTCITPAFGEDLEVAEHTIERPPWIRDPDHDEGFRLTSEVDDLSKRRGELTAVKPAEFSISTNLLEDETTFFVDAVAGYHFDVGRGDEVRLLTVPFALIERLFSATRDEVDKLGLGWQGSARTPLARRAQQEVALTPVYFTDSDLETDIGTLKLRWTPSLEPATGIPLGNVQEAGDLLVATGVDLLTDAGQVFDSGANPALLSEDAFLRLGGRLSLSIRGAADTLLERIQVDLSEKYLYNVGSDIEHINLVELAFSYLFPDVDNYRLTFSFTGGRDEDTLAAKAFWKTQVGVRF